MPPNERRKLSHQHGKSYRIYCPVGLFAEKAMAPHSSTLAWKIPWMEEPGRLQSMGSLRVKTRLSNFTFTFHFHALEKEMATQSTVLAWRIPGTGEPGGLPSMGSHRVRHDWSDLAAAATEPHGSLWPQVDECKQGRPGFCWSYMERICQLEALRSTEDEESGETIGSQITAETVVTLTLDE